MFRLTAVAAAVAVFVIGCGPNIKNSEQVRRDLLAHLEKNAGLDPKELDINITKLTFEGDQANATVSFRPKTATRIDSAMVMNYILDQKDGHWVVAKRGDSQKRGMQPTPGPGGKDIPKGHPPVTGKEEMPPDHPAVKPDAPAGQNR